MSIHSTQATGRSEPGYFAAELPQSKIRFAMHYSDANNPHSFSKVNWSKLLFWDDLLKNANALATRDISPPLKNDPPTDDQLLQYFSATWAPAHSKELTRIDEWQNDFRWPLTPVLPEIARLTHLKVLDLESSTLSELPPEISTLTQLTLLNLSCNQFQQVPEPLYSLLRLESLNLADNQITELSAKIANLKQLEWLSVAWNQLTHLPPEIGNLNQLHAFFFHGNPLTTLPVSFFNLLKNLERTTLLPGAMDRVLCWPKEAGPLIEAGRSEWLRSMGVDEEKDLSDPQVQQFRESFPRLWRQIQANNLFHCLQPPQQRKRAFLQAIALKEKMKEDHYVLHNAQHAAWLLVNTVAETCLGARSDRPLIRHPAFFANAPSFDQVQYTTDHLISDVLISAVAYLLSKNRGESAWAFFQRHQMQRTDWETTRAKIAQILSHHLPPSLDQEVVTRFAQELVDGEAKTLDGHTNLYAIAVPKEQFEQCGYLSFSFGEPYQPPGGSKEIHQLLRIMQADMEIQEQSSLQIQESVQVRLYAPALLALKGVSVHLFSSMEEQEMQALKARVRRATSAFLEKETSRASKRCKRSRRECVAQRAPSLNSGRLARPHVPLAE